MPSQALLLGLALTVLAQLPTQAVSQLRSPLFQPEAYVKKSADILKEYGYPAEEYEVETDDGYILQLDRIPNPGGYPIFIGNPVLSSALMYLYQGPDISLGFKLHDAGYDVWLGNYRGSVYSYKHKNLTENDDDFWRFSFHEHGMYDNPAFINFILEKTGSCHLAYAGYSMGCTTFFVMSSMIPEMNEKISAAFLMAPVVNLHKTNSTFINTLFPTHNITEVLTDMARINFFPHGVLRGFFETFCPRNFGIICNALVWFLFNSVEKNDYIKNCPDLRTTWPASGSLPTLWHFTQMADAPGRFLQYNFSPEKNLEVYGTETPPAYPIQNTTVPIYFYRGNSDTLTESQNFAFLESNLNTIRKSYLHPDPTFGHADFVWSKNAVVLNNDLISDLNSALQGVQTGRTQDGSCPALRA